MLDSRLTSALTNAVHDLERRSRAEVVIEVRSRSGSYAHANARFAALAAFATLATLLFIPWTVSPPWVLVDVAVAYGIALLVVRRTDSIRRAMTTSRERLARVRTTAAAVFHERGIANTSGETGVLVYFSELERRIEILADRGVLMAVPSLEWNRILGAAHERRATAAILVDVVNELAPLLALHMPVREGDVDELSNAPRFVNE